MAKRASPQQYNPKSGRRLGEINWRPVFSGNYGFRQPLQIDQIIAVRGGKTQIESTRQEDLSTRALIPAALID